MDQVELLLIVEEVVVELPQMELLHHLLVEDLVVMEHKLQFQDLLHLMLAVEVEEIIVLLQILQEQVEQVVEEMVVEDLQDHLQQHQQVQQTQVAVAVVMVELIQLVFVKVEMAVQV